MASELQWSIFCSTELQDVYVWQKNAPTQCPNNAGDTVVLSTAKVTSENNYEPGFNVSGGGAAAAFPALSPVYYDGANWQLAQANNIATVGTHVVSQSGADFDRTVRVMSTGNKDVGAHGLVVGDTYYTSQGVAGTTTNTKPATGLQNPMFKVIDSTTVEMIAVVQSIPAEDVVDHSTITITAGAGLTGGGDITASRTIDVGAGTGITVNANDIALSNTGVTPGAYTGADITVDAQGRITAATNGTGAPGTVTSVATGTGLSGGPITTTGTINLDINSLTTEATPVGGDFIPIYDVSATAERKVAISSLPSSGEVNTGANVGTGTGLVFRDKTGSTLNFKSLLQGTNMTVTNNANDITIATTAQNNIGANVGTGTGLVFRDKTGSTLNFKSLLAGSNITVTNNANDITLATTRRLDFAIKDPLAVANVPINASTFMLTFYYRGTGTGAPNSSVIVVYQNGANNAQSAITFTLENQTPTTIATGTVPTGTGKLSFSIPITGTFPAGATILSLRATLGNAGGTQPGFFYSLHIA